MRFTQEMIDVTYSTGYRAAYGLLQNVLQKKPPSRDNLVIVSGDFKAGRMYDSIMKFYDDKRFNPGTLRRHQNAPTILSTMRQLMDEDPDFYTIENYFSGQTDRTESVDTLVKEISETVGDNIANKFGPFTDNVIKTAAMVMHLQLERDTHDISALCHCFGVAGILYFLHETKNIPTEDIDKCKLAAEGFYHDFKEDLSSRIMDKKGQAYTVYRMDEFMQTHMPEKDLIDDISGVSNLYSAILKHAYGVVRRKDKGETLKGIYSIDTEKFTKDRMLIFLSDYLESGKDVNSQIYKSHDELYQMISERDYGTLKGNKLLDAMKLDAYAMYAHNITGHKRTIKFADQSYNLMGIKGLSSKRVPDTLLKTWMWSSEVYGSGVNLPYMNNFIMELLEDALSNSEYFIISDMRVNEANPIYEAGWTKNILKLSPIFYTDRLLRHDI